MWFVICLILVCVICSILNGIDSAANGRTRKSAKTKARIGLLSILAIPLIAITTLFELAKKYK